jgi:hypothetical protein
MDARIAALAEGQHGVVGREQSQERPVAAEAEVDHSAQYKRP